MRELGNIFGDAWGDVTSVVSDVVDEIPGASDALQFFGNEAQDFANTTFGQVCLRAFVTWTAYPALAGVLGPQLAAVSFALPGVAKGDDFDQAWLGEFMYRLEKTAEIVGGDAANQAAAQFQPIVDQLSQQAQNAGLDPQSFASNLEGIGAAKLQAMAQQLGVRADMLQTAIDYLAKESGFANAAGSVTLVFHGLIPVPVTDPVPVNGGLSFDPATGNVLGLANAQALTRAAVPRVNISAFLAIPLVRKPIASTVRASTTKARTSIAAKSVFRSAPKQPIVSAPPPAPHTTDSHPLAAPVPASSSQRVVKTVGVVGGLAAAALLAARFLL